MIVIDVLNIGGIKPPQAFISIYRLYYFNVIIIRNYNHSLTRKVYMSNNHLGNL